MARMDWSRLSREERAEYMRIQMAKPGSYGAGGYMPDDCSECGACGQPMLGVGLCNSCYNTWKRLKDKATNG